MAFWIAVAVITAIMVIGAAIAISQRDAEAFGGAFMIASVVTVVGAIVVGVGAGSGDREWQHQETYQLKALVTQQSAESHASVAFFLGFGGGTAGSAEVKSISYIRTADDGGSTLQEIDIDKAVIYEDGANSPRVEEWANVVSCSPAFVPWNCALGGHVSQYRFHIPEGSILQVYEVKP